VRKSKPIIAIDATQARHYWRHAASAVENNPSVLEDISLAMDGEIKKGEKLQKATSTFQKEPISHEESIQTFLHSWFFHEYVFLARYYEHNCILDVYPHRLAWGYSWEFLVTPPAVLQKNHRHVSIPMVREDLYIATWNEIQSELAQRYPDEPITAEWILYQTFARFPKASPLFEREQAFILEQFRREQ
jgi:hypothetical protein